MKEDNLRAAFSHWWFCNSGVRVWRKRGIALSPTVLLRELISFRKHKFSNHREHHSHIWGLFDLTHQVFPRGQWHGWVFSQCSINAESIWGKYLKTCHHDREGEKKDLNTPHKSMSARLWQVRFSMPFHIPKFFSRNINISSFPPCFHHLRMKCCKNFFAASFYQI